MNTGERLNVRFFPNSVTAPGEADLRRVVKAHHTLLKQSEIGHLFVQDEAAFAKLVSLIADFVVETCGGPQLFTEARGGGCMRTRHFPFTIDERGREVWLEKLLQAMGDVDFPQELREEYWNWLEAISIRMINRRTTKAQPERISWAQAARRSRRDAGQGAAPRDRRRPAARFDAGAHPGHRRRHGARRRRRRPGHERHLADAPKEGVIPPFRRGEADLLLIHGSDETYALQAAGLAAPLRAWAMNEHVIVGPDDDPPHSVEGAN